MADIIRLLPDNIANQIAFVGEVIQRPASSGQRIDEKMPLMLGATEIKVILKDSGKTLIQVIDNGLRNDRNGCPTMFWTAYHIQNQKNGWFVSIYEQRALGRRWLIAAIAHVEMITRPTDAELANRITINGSKIEKQDYVQGSHGTNFAVKNLFYNVPARKGIFEVGSSWAPAI